MNLMQNTFPLGLERYSVTSCNGPLSRALRIRTNVLSCQNCSIIKGQRNPIKSPAVKDAKKTAANQLECADEIGRGAAAADVQ